MNNTGKKPHDTLKMARRALAILEEQAAGYTALTIPPHLKIELEEKRREVAELEQRLGLQSEPYRETTTGNPAHVLNPFLNRGRINDPAHFFDRRRILRELRQMLAAGNSISLVGGQEIGKSSLLVYLYQTRAEWLPDIAVIYLDLQGMVNEKDFCAEVLERLGEEPEGGLRRFKRVLRRSRTLLLLDEVEKLTDPAFSSRLHDLLRALAQEPSLTLTVASHSPLVEVFPPTSSTSPLHNIFTEKRLGPFAPGDARAFLAQRLAATGMTFTPAEQQQLVIASGGHPAHLQRLAYDLFEQKRR